MNFNSIDFVSFYLLVLALYVALRSAPKIQNILLLTASLYFYACWSFPYLGLLLATILLDFFLALRMDKTASPAARKVILSLSIISNLSVLGFFKYFNFLASTAASGLHFYYHPLAILLPIGISFYTFHSMSYTIDVYRRTIKPTRRVIDFMLYVTFFPQLMAGPIARASSLLPQMGRARTITPEQVNSGIFLILWGFCQKLVIADNLAKIANPIFTHPADWRGVDLLWGTVAFSFQILGDFAGYTDIARGLSKLMGFELALNFNLPYLAENPKDFWSRWHISLSTWFRDYVYIPLGGNRVEGARRYINILLTMLLAGLWHGAAWTFVLWGLYHGLGLAAYHWIDARGAMKPGSFLQRCRKASPKFLKIGITFIFTLIGWVIFRCQTLGQISYVLTHVSLKPGYVSGQLALTLMALIVPYAAVQWIQHEQADLLALAHTSVRARPFIYAALFLMICLFGQGASPNFIYFRF